MKEQIFGDRRRTNVLKDIEQKVLLIILKRVPSFISSDALTILGGLGSVLVFIAFYVAAFQDRRALLAVILGLAINWLGDSLDGRLAYYRNRVRKWYGYSLDVVMDWLSVACISLGYYAYADEEYKLAGLTLILLYGWAILIAQLRYKVTDNYTIDFGAFGPTEIRVLISTVVMIELVYPSSIHYSAIIISGALLLLNIADTKKLLALGDERDVRERSSDVKR